MSQQRVAHQEINRWIAAGEYGPGDKLPTLSQMAKRLGVSQTPVRNAIQRLAQEGKVRTRNGVGVFVREPGAGVRRFMVLARTPRSLDGVFTGSGGFLISEVHDGITAAVRRRNIASLFCFQSDFGDDPENVVERLKAERCDGVLLLDATLDVAFGLTMRLGPSRVVSCIYGGELSPLNEVKVRVEPGVRDVLAEAYRLGHRRFGMLYASNVALHWSHSERFRAFLRFCHDHDVRLDPECLIETGGEAIDAYRATLRLLDESPELTALFAVTDLRAFGAIHAIEDRGLRVGQDISVIGFDDMPEAAGMDLATVRIPRQRIGEEAVELLCRCLDEGRVAQRVWVETTAVPRASLGSPEQNQTPVEAVAAGAGVEETSAVDGEA